MRRVWPAVTLAYRLGSYELQPAQRRLLMDGQQVLLGHRAFAVLLVLVERAGKLVTKDELLALAWPGMVVEENNLQVQVSSLRKVLGTAAIATVPGQGYRLTLEPERIGESAPPATVKRHPLPQPLTSFIGHEDDLDECAALLEQTRLLTLTGIGGCGKTRLAIELAERILPAYEDGVWYVDLAPLLDPERLALTVATTLGLREESDRPVVETVCDRLSGQHALLVLDNCEHLAAACAAMLDRLIAVAPRMRFLATSREGLSVRGERAVTVRSLSFPPADAKHDLARLEASESVRLFVERARQLVPRFVLSHESAPAVAEICRRLDGIPLAIELAAARVKMLSVEEIRSRLDDRFRLLRGSSKTALARQQTLLATIQWSYDHLSADQQRLLRRLSVFAGGWTLEGAADVDGDQADEYVVLDLLTCLVDQSLVTTHAIDGGATRYSMLETVRQYAQERLHEAGESDATRHRHLERYVVLAEKAEPELGGQGQRAWFARLDQECENLLAAHAWCEYDPDGAELGLRLVYALNLYLTSRGLLELGYRVTVEALAREGAKARSVHRCRALWAAGTLGYFTGRYRETKDLAEMSLAIAREIGDGERVSEALRVVGYGYLTLGDRTTAQACLQEGLAITRQLGDPQRISRMLNALAEFHRAGDELEQAQPLYEEALVLSRELGNRLRIAILLSNLACTEIALGSGDRAREMLREGLAVAQEVGSKRAGVALLEGTVGLAALLGCWHWAARLYGASEALAAEMSDHREPPDEAFLAPIVARTRDALGATAFAEAESAGGTLTYENAIAEARARLDEGF